MDYTFNEQMTVQAGSMTDWISGIFKAVGMNGKDARKCAHHLVTADARGVYSHGCMRVGIYCGRLLHGGTNPKGRPRIVKRKGCTILVDGDNAMGPVVGLFAMKEAVKLAGKFGSAAASVFGSNHIGACAYYAMMAADADMVAFCWTIGGSNIMAPWGGRDPRLGNNPLAIAVPCEGSPHVVLDMAQSVVARGKIVMARKTRTPIPETWALDSDGKPTTDPEAAFLGTLQPVGGYKGYGMAFMTGIISALLSGATFGPDIVDGLGRPDAIQNAGHLFQLIDIAAFTSPAEFKKRVHDAVMYMKEAQKADGVQEILVPGEAEARKLERQLKDGIQYPMEVIEELRALSRKLGVAVTI
ncbi:MAG: Ldh family oxidoreductase [Deltaproteobacteria bacterium]|jgi:LDH2 family malate/lactate/ureidoglycolate dehydrogenase|nr:Ldh family oxidoreductase [Deltaproteobacteria bacterium]